MLAYIELYKYISIVATFLLAYFNLLKPSGNFTHHQFNIQKFDMLLRVSLLFCVDLRTNSDYFPIQH
jgi:hypothetical protein